MSLDAWMNANMAVTLEGDAIQSISAEVADALDRGDSLEGLVGAESVNNVSDVTHALVRKKQEGLYLDTSLEFERTVLERGRRRLQQPHLRLAGGRQHGDVL